MELGLHGPPLQDYRFLQNQQIPSFSSAVTSTTNTVSSSFSCAAPAMGTGYSSSSQSVLSSLPMLPSSHTQSSVGSSELLNKVYSIVHQTISSILSQNSPSTNGGLQEQPQVPSSYQHCAVDPYAQQQIPFQPSNCQTSQGYPSFSHVYQEHSQLPSTSVRQPMWNPPTHQPRQHVAATPLQHDVPGSSFQQPLHQHPLSVSSFQQPQLQRPFPGSSYQQVPDVQLSDPCRRPPQQQQIRKAKVLSSKSSLSDLCNLTIKNPQYRAIDFAKLSNLPYTSQIEPSKINMPTFAFGSVKHLIALCDGTLPPISHQEFINRLNHLANVFEICCLGSSPDEYQNSNWCISLAYDKRLISDIEAGIKDWNSLNRSIDPTCWSYAKEFSCSPEQRLAGPDHHFSEFPVKTCTSWNTFMKQGCQYEFLNPGRSCKYLHFCSTCKENGFGELPHKAWECLESDGDDFLNSEIDFDNSP